MNAYLNYLLEASIGLSLFLLIYIILLKKETDFAVKRVFLLAVIIISITAPLFKFNTQDSPVPSLNFSVPAETIPTIFLGASDTQAPSTIRLWEAVAILYGIGLLLFMVAFLVKVAKIFSAVRQSPQYRFNNHTIVELQGNFSPFSFFNYIFIGSSTPLTDAEKEQVFTHEAIHARLYHSIDILLINTLGIIFWFNPIIRFYKKIFVQLHEFEADARAVEKHDVDDYCSLVAKVALQSADFRLANHFSNSLTIKRIEMMRTLKQKIKNWKIIAASAIVPVFFFVVSCQDQVEGIQKAEATAYPANVQQTLDKLKSESPKDRFIVVSPTGHNPEDFKGHENHISVINGEFVYEANLITVVNSDKKDASGNTSRYLILQYTENNVSSKSQAEADEMIDKIVEEVPQGDPVFLVVEKAPTYPGGLDKMNAFIFQNLKYPQQAVQDNTEGSVFVSFIVEKDGNVSEANIIKGISKECDAEALRVVKQLGTWTPGMQSGKPVRVRFVIPIKFKL
jgi:TonB family protein